MSKENRTGNPADIRNPFGAPVFYQAETGSTMDDAREIVHRFTAEGIPVAEGTVAAAGFQHGGRGRIPARKWDSPPGENLICTTILHFPPPACITLRTGLAVAETFARFLPAGAGDVEIKWPNDVLCAGRKLAGILCESDGRFVYLPEEMKLIKFLPDGTIFEEILAKGIHRIDVALNEIALFIRSGKCIPVADAAECVDSIDYGTIRMYGYEGAEYTLYNDDGIHKDYDNKENYTVLRK